MTDIIKLEGRIAAAMERIGRAIEAFGPPPEGAASLAELDNVEAVQAEARLAGERARAAEDEVARLRQALEAENTASAQLRELVGSLKSMKERQQDRIAELEAELEALAEQRGADRAELDGLIAAIEPLVREQTGA